LSEPAITLRDAFSAYDTQRDLIMKLFTFLQVVAVAVSAFMWTTGRQRLSHTPVVVGYTIFALGNGLLLWIAYRDAKRVTSAIRSYRASHRDEIPEAWCSLFSISESYPGWLLVVIHVFVDLVAIVAIIEAPM
jgi:hypothetical protein